ncbi:MAG: transporter [Gallionella sp.]|nr:MAG: transporter [Gallionella sp.]
MKFKQTVVGWSVASALLAMSGSVAASGFALIEQSGSGLGNAYAGGAASAEDASTIFFNPAGMSRLSGKQVVVVANTITPSIKFTNIASVPAAGQAAVGGAGGDAGGMALVPSAYFAWALDPKWSAGLGFGAPFGLKTEYDANWMGRFHAIKSDIKTYNLNPSVAYKANDNVALGFGVNWQRAEAELTKAVNYVAFGAPANTEGSNKIVGNDSAWGYNLGAMINVTPDTVVGLAYRSAMSYRLSGSAAYYGRTAALDAGVAGSAALAAQIGDSQITADIKLPATYSVAVKHQLNPKWEVLADATQTRWSSIQSLDIYRSSGIASGLSLESVPFKWRDTWRVGAGANYRYDSQWLSRVGIAYDQTPTSDTYRIARLPDQDRTWLSVGGQYKPTKESAVDFGYAHLFIKDPSLNMSGPPALSAAQATGRGALIGVSDNKVDILSVQYTHGF